MLDVHGGPIGNTDDRFPGTLDALLLSRGFAILEPNPRGSTGHGQAFARRVVGDMGGLDVDDVLAGVDAAVAGGLRRPRSPRADRRQLRGIHGGVDPDARPALQGFGVDLAGDRLVVGAVRQQPRSVGRATSSAASRTRCPRSTPAEAPCCTRRRSRRRCCSPSGRHDRATPVGQAVEFYRALRERRGPVGGRLVPGGGARCGRVPRDHRSRHAHASRGSSGSCRRATAGR